VAPISVAAAIMTTARPSIFPNPNDKEYDNDDDDE
jgi:hypothetical protein